MPGLALSISIESGPEAPICPGSSAIRATFVVVPRSRLTEGSNRSETLLSVNCFCCASIVTQ